MKKQILQILKTLSLSAILLVSGYYLIGTTNQPVSAASTIVVNSTADDIDDTDGECTLREAIIAANTDTASGVAVGECAAGNNPDTINFALTGTADYTLGGQNGYTIDTTDQLPIITDDDLTINGYSQTGSLANTAPSPNPFNGRLLVQIDFGGDPGNSEGIRVEDTDNVTVRGLVLSDSWGWTLVARRSTDVHFAGNYVGVSPDGMTLDARDFAGTAFLEGVEDSVIGGLNPEDRNLSAADTGTAISVGNYIDGTDTLDSNNNIVQGNYAGLAADGVTVINGSGTAVDFSGGTGNLFGGNTEAATNVVGAQFSALNVAGSVEVRGNIIGLDYTGTTDLGGNFGIIVAGANNAVIINNTISGFNGANVVLSGLPNPSTNVRIQGNRIGTNSSGEYDATITNGIGVGFSGGVNNALLGGTGDSDGNIIAHGAIGVTVARTYYSGFDLTANSTEISILGNSIYDNAQNVSLAFFGVTDPDRIGIDLYDASDDDGDFSIDALTNFGQNTNDGGDGDSGPNDYINHPVFISTNQVDQSLNYELDLDVAGSPSDEYRVEFFANDEINDAGAVEGQTYLGFANMSSGLAKSGSLTLSPGVDLTGKYLTATVTAINSNNNFGFGPTSEFSVYAEPTSVTFTAQGGSVSSPGAGQGNLASTGESSQLPVIGAVLAILLSLGLLVYKSRISGRA